MLINRQIVLEKLNSFLANKISQQEVYEWALLAAVSSESAAGDPLLSATLKAMIEVNYGDPARSGTKNLEYYAQCLAGQAEFVPEKAAELKKMNAPAASS